MAEIYKKIKVENLPAVVRDIADVIGVSQTFVLIENIGGNQVLIPKKDKPDQILSHMLDPAAYGKLCAAFGGCPVYIPKMTAQLLKVRNDRIRTDRSLGCQVRFLVKKYGLSDRQILKIVNSCERKTTNTKQLTLFG